MAILVNRMKWTGWAGPSAGIFVGVLLMAAPSLFSYTNGPHEIVQRIAGPLMTMLWIPSYWEATRSLVWWASAIALCLLIASLIVPGEGVAQVTGVLSALATVAIALLTHHGNIEDRYAGGWAGLWRGEQHHTTRDR